MVGVRHFRSGAEFIQFIRIAQAVGVGVLVAVNYPISVRVLNQRLGAYDVHFNSVAESVLVGVGHCWIGLVNCNFNPVI